MTTALVLEKAERSGSGFDLVLRHEGWTAERVTDPQEAFERLGKKSFDLLVAGVDTLRIDSQWLATVRERFPDLPVVLVTGRGRAHEQTVKALLVGAATFVPRDRLTRDLVTTIERIVSLSCHDSAPAVGTVLTETRHHYTLPNDRKDVAPILRHIQDELGRFDICEKSERLRVAIALEEAMINAIVHGNLEVSSKLREQGDDTFEQAIAHKRSTSPYRDRKATLVAAFSPHHATFVVSDEGAGFDPNDVPDPTDPENLIKPHGRGLLLMRTFMDHVEHNEIGNEVTLIKRKCLP
jgi:anti-sigma regulatory factor (Ser/Thr protein kinase)